MNQLREGILEGLGVALFLAMKYRKQPQRLLPALIAVTERVQLVQAKDTLDILNAQTRESAIPREKL